MNARSNVLSQRLDSLRLATALALAVFVFDAGLIVLIISALSKSAPAALLTLGLMLAVVVAMLLWNEGQLLRRVHARDPHQGEFPWLKPTVNELAQRIGIAEPEVLIGDTEEINAFTTRSGASTKIVFMTGLLDLLPREEVAAVAAHELGHAANRDITLAVWMGAMLGWIITAGTVVSLIGRFVIEFSLHLPEELAGEAMGFGLLFGIVFAAIGVMLGGSVWLAAQLWIALSRLAELAVQRQREFLADATSAAITRQPLVLADALETLEATNQGAISSRIAACFSVGGPHVRAHWWDDLVSTHPSTEQRIRELKALSLDELPVLTSSWEGIGPATWLLPAASFALLIVLALTLPSCA